jgi:lipopolysaccharide/colanic/teichoic acid biosynthesis glycosyltransferase
MKLTKLTKRAIDVGVSATGLVLLSPLLAVLALIVAVSLGRPVLFRQVRPGLNARQFTIVKFRTMREAHDTTTFNDAQRLTKVGQWMRSLSLDELPELWNVLVGDMSLVGPRPLLVEYLDRYTPEQARRHEVRPGITGWAQVNGRNALSWGQKFKLDVWYVDNQSLRLDLKILALTVWQVIARRGISADGHATMPPFTGEKLE